MSNAFFARIKGKRLGNLSITHMSSAHQETDFDISETRHAAPDDGVAGRRVAGAIQVSAETRELR
jgi:hypothetical protein